MNSLTLEKFENVKQNIACILTSFKMSMFNRASILNKRFLKLSDVLVFRSRFDDVEHFCKCVETISVQKLCFFARSNSNSRDVISHHTYIVTIKI